MQLEQALNLLDKNGEPIKWEKQEDGSYTAKLEEKGSKDVNGKELPGNTYIYSITPQTTIVDVGVVEVVEGTAPEGPVPKAEAKKAEASSSSSSSSKSKKF